MHGVRGVLGLGKTGWLAKGAKEQIRSFCIAKVAWLEHDGRGAITVLGERASPSWILVGHICT